MEFVTRKCLQLFISTLFTKLVFFVKHLRLLPVSKFWSIIIKELSKQVTWHTYAAIYYQKSPSLTSNQLSIFCYLMKSVNLINILLYKLHDTIILAINLESWYTLIYCYYTCIVTGGANSISSNTRRFSPFVTKDNLHRAVTISSTLVYQN